MPFRYFSPMADNAADYNGRHILKNTGGSVYSGQLAQVEASGSCLLSAGSPEGMFFDLLGDVELPTSDNIFTYRAGKRTAFIGGAFEALLSADLFKQAALPAVNAKLYDGGNGYVDTVAVGAAIGRVLQAPIPLQTKDGVVNLARCRFNFVSVL